MTGDEGLLTGLRELIETLRGENGCPWDRKQTPETMAVYLLEEVHELVEAVAGGSDGEVCEEMGDVLFQLLFLCDLYEERGAFHIEDAISGIVEKMIRRHPHVFGEAAARDHDAVMEQWEKIKREEKPEKAKGSLLDRVPSGLPALVRAYRVSEITANAGFDWDTMEGVQMKVKEEWGEFNQALASGNREDIAMEFGDLLFTLTNVARFAGIHPETALAASTRKFERRYRLMEGELASRGEELASLSREEVDGMWESAKRGAQGGE